MKRIVILSDLQVPFEDIHLTQNIARFLKTFKPDQTVTIGDEIDFQTISKWSEGTPQAYEQSLGDDRDRCVDLLWELGVTDCIRSNHTDRFDRYIERNAPALATLKGLKYTELIGIKDLGITWHEQPGLIAPNTILAHGDEGSLAQYAGGTAAKLVERMGKNVVCGHTHRQGIIWRSTGLRGRLEPLFGFEAGHLMAVRKAAYTRPLNAPNWQMGFGMLEVSGSLVNPISIIMRPDGSFTWDKKTWG